MKKERGALWSWGKSQSSSIITSNKRQWEREDKKGGEKRDAKRMMGRLVVEEVLPDSDVEATVERHKIGGREKEMREIRFLYVCVICLFLI